ncbi:LLM class flavin-dependent oxidoreductase [Pseudonocardia pini]|uniref:LLM class flavin-dependent oxidoreductase n=1 Tax=Pseudonocardia pini TaxID=2758030 RepID=UPI001C694099|nr:LLM class flavin-dependent oxidoreductase [Pseudonocardia pini]
MTVSIGPVRVGLGLLDGNEAVGRREFLDSAAAAGIDHVVNWDHVSFRGGWGTDGLVRSTADLCLNESIGAYVSVYLLALRHPVLVARQLASLGEIAPGRLVLGVGVGGDDRAEVLSAGVDPRTRGRRMDESLTVLRRLLAGETVTFHGEFFTLDEVRVLPAPAPPIPIVVGGRSDAAVRRAGLLGDGWVGVWCSANRFREATARVDAEARAAGRSLAGDLHTMQIWAGIGDGALDAEEQVRTGIEGFVKLPFDGFAKYCAWGDAAAIADYARPYLEAGCRRFNFVGCSRDPSAAAEVIGEVAGILRRLGGT